jgi:hypothetical protein
MNMKKIAIGTLLCWLFSILPARAQQPDTLGNLKTFLQVCNAYKQLPLQMTLGIHNTTNLVTGAEDTIQASVTFYLQQQGTYIRFGELEQVANDSLLLLVSDNLKQMMLYNHQQSVAGQLQQYLGFQWQDASLQQIAARFKATVVPLQNDTACIELASRQPLPHTTLPRETVRVVYDPVSGTPFRVEQLKRTLVPLNEDVYNNFAADAAWQGQLLKLTDKKEALFFAIRQQASLYTYENISHEPGKKLPVTISDRIAAAGTGAYTPAKAYADYLLTQNF